ncbi:MAG: S-layer homology domain-containing protein [Dethiobacter sp.]|nr:S-layer homology domain-containing protein [Dethiobacter sp.]MCL5982873.1 S-layer homology domain-containing protein [Bacillota bacterium]
MKRTVRFYSTLLALLLALSLPAQAAAPYTRTEPIVYTVRHSYRVENRGPVPVTNIVLTLPAFHPEPFSNQELLTSRWNIPPSRTSRDRRGNLTAEFTLPRLEVGASAEIVLEALVRNFGVAFHLEREGENFSQPDHSYLQPEPKVESTHPEIISKVSQITKGLPGAVEQARAIFAFVHQHMTYDTSPEYSNQGALEALRSGRGVCEDYAGLFVALCRASGIPARLVYGYAAAQAGQSFEAHAWAEFFLSSHGWIPVEPTVHSAEVPWQYFAALPPEYRHLVFSLQPKEWRWTWFGGRGSIDALFTSTVLAGRFMALFGDVPSGHWAYAVIENLASRGLVAGYRGNFAPSRAVTRAEFAKLVALARGLAPDYGVSTFSDVQQGDWFHAVVTAASRAGLLSGFPDGTFRPHKPVTREQAAAILARALAADSQTPARGVGGSLPFADNEAIAPWALPAVIFTVEKQLFGGDPQNLFRPQDHTTRAEAAALIHRYLSM